MVEAPESNSLKAALCSQFFHPLENRGQTPVISEGAGSFKIGTLHSANEEFTGNVHLSIPTSIECDIRASLIFINVIVREEHIMNCVSLLIFTAE